jgi:hypothetical protein
MFLKMVFKFYFFQKALTNGSLPFSINQARGVPEEQKAPRLLDEEQWHDCDAIWIYRLV